MSYKDEDWWNGTLGEKYLEKHKELIEKNKDCKDCHVERVFIVQGAPTGAGLSKLQNTLNKQTSLGISVYTVYEEGTIPLPEQLRMDFVIYDDIYVRTGAFESGTLRKAILSVNPVDINGAKRKFEELKAWSTLWKPAKQEEKTK